MASFKYDQFLIKQDCAEFDEVFYPGEQVKQSGIYRCTACGFEESLRAGQLLPATRVCFGHSVRWRVEPGLVNWQLVVCVAPRTRVPG